MSADPASSGPASSESASLLSTAVGRLRAVSALEGLSYAVLVFVAMPLKYGFDMPWLVQMMGRAHGALFVAFSVALVLAWRERGWGMGRPTGLMAWSLVPLGAFQIERMLRREE